MSQPLTLKDLFDFVLENKKDKTFLGYNDTEILLMLQKGIQEETLFYSTNEENKITGMILAEKKPELGVLFVTENLAMNLKTLREFANKAKINFAGYKLEWLKHGILKQHDTDKIYKKLSI